MPRRIVIFVIHYLYLVLNSYYNHYIRPPVSAYYIFYLRPLVSSYIIVIFIPLSMPASTFFLWQMYSNWGTILFQTDVYNKFCAAIWFLFSLRATRRNPSEDSSCRDGYSNQAHLEYKITVATLLSPAQSLSELFKIKRLHLKSGYHLTGCQ